MSVLSPAMYENEIFTCSMIAEAFIAGHGYKKDDAASNINKKLCMHPATQDAVLICRVKNFHWIIVHVTAAYVQGIRASIAGEKFSNCPYRLQGAYDRNMDKKEQWEEGYHGFLAPLVQAKFQ